MAYPTTGLSLRVVIDGTMILMMVFFAGTGWNKLDEMQAQIDRTTVSAERMARMEEKIDYLIREVNRLQTKADR